MVAGQPDLPVIGPGVVAVWNVWLGGTPDDGRASAVLSGDELARASRFVFDVDRNRYLTGRLALRHLLGRYLDRDPSDVRFAYSSYGKPELPGETLRFNVAHCDDLAIIGLTEQHRLGVDVERIRDLEEVDGLASTAFSPQELDAFHALPDASKSRGFFEYWTRKEAFVKAVGYGLSHPLEGSPARAAAWSLFDVIPMVGWVGAVAVECPDAALKRAGWLGEPPTRPFSAS